MCLYTKTHILRRKVANGEKDGCQRESFSGRSPVEASTVQWKKQAMIKSFQLVLHVGATAVAFAASSGITPALSQTKQEHVHEMGRTVMPFDLTKTTHIFRMTDSGGVQSVVVKDARDKDQVGLIRQHLRREAEAFQRGDYTDPTSLHGAKMPGVSELTSHHQEIAVSYSEFPLGAAITFETQDRHLVTAVHRWFGAQLSEHGADARSE
jgi:hypothetical protein